MSSSEREPSPEGEPSPESQPSPEGEPSPESEPSESEQTPKYKFVVVSIKDGINYAYLKDKILRILVNFGEKSKTSQSFTLTSDTPVFNSNFCWCVEENRLNELLNEHMHLTIELRTEYRHREDNVGFATLGLYEAQYIPTWDGVPIFFSREITGVQRPSGCRDPEINLSIQFQDLKKIKCTEDWNYATLNIDRPARAAFPSILRDHHLREDRERQEREREEAEYERRAEELWQKWMEQKEIELEKRKYLRLREPEIVAQAFRDWDRREQERLKEEGLWDVCVPSGSRKHPRFRDHSNYPRTELNKTQEETVSYSDTWTFVSSSEPVANSGASSVSKLNHSAIAEQSPAELLQPSSSKKTSYTDNEESIEPPRGHLTFISFSPRESEGSAESESAHPDSARQSPAKPSGDREASAVSESGSLDKQKIAKLIQLLRGKPPTPTETVVPSDQSCDRKVSNDPTEESEPSVESESADPDIANQSPDKPSSYESYTDRNDSNESPEKSGMSAVAESAHPDSARQSPAKGDRAASEVSESGSLDKQKIAKLIQLLRGKPPTPTEPVVPSDQSCDRKVSNDPTEESEPSVESESADPDIANQSPDKPSSYESYTDRNDSNESPEKSGMSAVAESAHPDSARQSPAKGDRAASEVSESGSLDKQKIAKLIQLLRGKPPTPTEPVVPSDEAGTDRKVSNDPTEESEASPESESADPDIANQSPDKPSSHESYTDRKESTESPEQSEVSAVSESTHPDGAIQSPAKPPGEREASAVSESGSLDKQKIAKLIQLLRGKPPTVVPTDQSCTDRKVYNEPTGESEVSAESESADPDIANQSPDKPSSHESYTDRKESTESPEQSEVSAVSESTHPDGAIQSPAKPPGEREASAVSESGSLDKQKIAKLIQLLRGKPPTPTEPVVPSDEAGTDRKVSNDPTEESEASPESESADPDIANQSPDKPSSHESYTDRKESTESPEQSEVSAVTESAHPDSARQSPGKPPEEREASAVSESGSLDKQKIAKLIQLLRGKPPTVVPTDQSCTDRKVYNEPTGESEVSAESESADPDIANQSPDKPSSHESYTDRKESTESPEQSEVSAVSESTHPDGAIQSPAKPPGEREASAVSESGSLDKQKIAKLIQLLRGKPPTPTEPVVPSDEAGTDRKVSNDPTEESEASPESESADPDIANQSPDKPSSHESYTDRKESTESPEQSEVSAVTESAHPDSARQSPGKPPEEREASAVSESGSLDKQKIAKLIQLLRGKPPTVVPTDQSCTDRKVYNEPTGESEVSAESESADPDIANQSPDKPSSHESYTDRKESTESSEQSEVSAVTESAHPDSATQYPAKPSGEREASAVSESGSLDKQKIAKLIQLLRGKPPTPTEPVVPSDEAGTDRKVSNEPTGQSEASAESVSADPDIANQSPDKPSSHESYTDRNESNESPEKSEAFAVAESAHPDSTRQSPGKRLQFLGSRTPTKHIVISSDESGRNESNEPPAEREASAVSETAHTGTVDKQQIVKILQILRSKTPPKPIAVSSSESYTDTKESLEAPGESEASAESELADADIANQSPVKSSQLHDDQKQIEHVAPSSDESYTDRKESYESPKKREASAVAESGHPDSAKQSPARRLQLLGSKTPTKHIVISSDESGRNESNEPPAKREASAVSETAHTGTVDKQQIVKILQILRSKTPTKPVVIPSEESCTERESNEPETSAESEPVHADIAKQSTAKSLELHDNKKQIEQVATSTHESYSGNKEFNEPPGGSEVSTDLESTYPSVAVGSSTEVVHSKKPVKQVGTSSHKSYTTDKEQCTEPPGKREASYSETFVEESSAELMQLAKKNEASSVSKPFTKVEHISRPRTKSREAGKKPKSSVPTSVATDEVEFTKSMQTPQKQQSPPAKPKAERPATAKPQFDQKEKTPQALIPTATTNREEVNRTTQTLEKYQPPLKTEVATSITLIKIAEKTAHATQTTARDLNKYTQTPESQAESPPKIPYLGDTKSKGAIKKVPKKIDDGTQVRFDKELHGLYSQPRYSILSYEVQSEDNKPTTGRTTVSSGVWDSEEVEFVKPPPSSSSWYDIESVVDEPVTKKKPSRSPDQVELIIEEFVKHKRRPRSKKTVRKHREEPKPLSRIFRLELRFREVEWFVKLSEMKMSIKFYNPHTKSRVAIENRDYYLPNLNLDDVVCCMHYVALLDDLMQAMADKPPQILFYKAPSKLGAQGNLQITSFKKVLEPKTYETYLPIINKQEVLLAAIHVFVTVEDLGLFSNNKSTSLESFLKYENPPKKLSSKKRAKKQKKHPSPTPKPTTLKDLTVKYEESPFGQIIIPTILVKDLKGKIKKFVSDKKATFHLEETSAKLTETPSNQTEETSQDQNIPPQIPVLDQGFASNVEHLTNIREKLRETYGKIDTCFDEFLSLPSVTKIQKIELTKEYKQPPKETIKPVKHTKNPKEKLEEDPLYDDVMMSMVDLYPFTGAPERYVPSISITESKTEPVPATDRTGTFPYAHISDTITEEVSTDVRTESEVKQKIPKETKTKSKVPKTRETLWCSFCKQFHIVTKIYDYIVAIEPAHPDEKKKEGVKPEDHVFDKIKFPKLIIATDSSGDTSPGTAQPSEEPTRTDLPPTDSDPKPTGTIPKPSRTAPKPSRTAPKSSGGNPKPKSAQSVKSSGVQTLKPCKPREMAYVPKPAVTVIKHPCQGCDQYLEVGFGQRVWQDQEMVFWCKDCYIRKLQTEVKDTMESCSSQMSTFKEKMASLEDEFSKHVDNSVSKERYDRLCEAQHNLTMMFTHAQYQNESLHMQCNETAKKLEELKQLLPQGSTMFNISQEAEGQFHKDAEQMKQMYKRVREIKQEIEVYRRQDLPTPAAEAPKPSTGAIRKQPQKISSKLSSRKERCEACRFKENQTQVAEAKKMKLNVPQQVQFDTRDSAIKKENVPEVKSTRKSIYCVHELRHKIEKTNAKLQYYLKERDELVRINRYTYSNVIVHHMTLNINKLMIELAQLRNELLDQ